MVIPRLRFIESFDSARFSGDPGAQNQSRMLHAEFELLLSLLFGDVMVVSEPQAFDSIGFLAIASQVMNARGAIGLNQSPVSLPIRLAWRAGPGREYGTYCEMVAHSLAQSHETFELSALSPISKDTDLRIAIAEKIREGKHPEAQALGGDSIRDQLEQIQFLDQNLFAIQQPIKTREPKLTLQEYIYRLNELSIQSSTSISDLALSELIDAAISNGANFETRTGFRTTFLPKLTDPKQASFLSEFVDSAYNHIVAYSTTASRGSFSTSGSATNAQTMMAELLAEGIDEELVAGPKSIWETDFIIDAEGRSDKKPGPPQGLHDVWPEFWVLAAREDWQLSVARLRARQGVKFHYREVLREHIALLDEYFGSALTVEGDWNSGNGGASSGAIKFVIKGITGYLRTNSVDLGEDVLGSLLETVGDQAGDYLVDKLPNSVRIRGLQHSFGDYVYIPSDVS